LHIWNVWKRKSVADFVAESKQNKTITAKKQYEKIFYSLQSFPFYFKQSAEKSGAATVLYDSAYVPAVLLMPTGRKLKRLYSNRQPV
jgi:hypothetical protein